jgi:uncharacterized protein YndB with AHSA1/START domain
MQEVVLMTNPAFTVDNDKIEVVLTRVVDASRESIWQACTDVNQIAHWWGPRRVRTTINQWEPRAGGKWRILHVAPDNSEHWFNGEYREVNRPHRLVRTFIYERRPCDVIRETLLLNEVACDKTMVTNISDFPSVTSLNTMINDGMQQGAIESFDRLAELVEQFALV